MNEKTQKISTVIFIVIFCVFISDVIAKKNTSSPYKNEYNPTFEKSFNGIAHVIDGDSIKVAGKEARLIGIDAPEYSQTCFDKDDKEYDCGKLSQKFLFNLAHKKQVTCYYAQKDVYDRFLAKCEIFDLSINKEILKNGMAVIYDYRQASEELKAIEKEARSNKIGIWQGKFQLPKDYQKRRK